MVAAALLVEKVRTTPYTLGRARNTMNSEKKARTPMEPVFWIAGFLALWVLLQLVILPRLGVST